MEIIGQFLHGILPESFGVLLAYVNWCYCCLFPSGITKFIKENAMNFVSCSQMMPL